MTSGTGPIHPQTLFFIPQRSDTYIQIQHNSASDTYVGSHALESSWLYQSTNYRDNTDVNDDDSSQSFGTMKENNCGYSCFGDKINKTTTPNPSTLPPYGK